MRETPTTEIVKLGFANLGTHIEKGFATIADDIDDLDHKIMSLRATTETSFLSLRDEVHEIIERHLGFKRRSCAQGREVGFRSKSALARGGPRRGVSHGQTSPLIGVQ